MDQHKLDNFLRAHQGGAFPRFAKVDETRCATIRRRLGLLLFGREEVAPLDLVKRIAGLGELIERVNAEDPEFSLSDLLHELGISAPQHIFINWYRFDQIDLMVLADLSAYFDDIWYPSADDIDLFDESLTWVLSVRHDGAIQLLRLGSARTAL